MDGKGLREVVRDGLGCAVVLAVLGIGALTLVAGVAAHAYGAGNGSDTVKAIKTKDVTRGNTTPVH